MAYIKCLASTTEPTELSDLSTLLMSAPSSSANIYLNNVQAKSVTICLPDESTHTTADGVATVKISGSGTNPATITFLQDITVYYDGTAVDKTSGDTISISNNLGETHSIYWFLS